MLAAGVRYAVGVGSARFGHAVEAVHFDHTVEAVHFDQAVEAMRFDHAVEAVHFEQVAEAMCFDYAVVALVVAYLMYYQKKTEGKGKRMDWLAERSAVEMMTAAVEMETDKKDSQVALLGVL